MSRSTWLTSFVVLALMGCSETNPVSKYRDIGETRNLLTTADLRMVTARRVPYGFDVMAGHAAGDHEVICTEPSPDVAKAVSTLASGSVSLNLNLPVAGAVVNEAGSAEGTRATAEQVAQLTERVPPIQALRDGLYRACEAYANQVLGRNAYALILSRADLVLEVTDKVKSVKKPAGTSPPRTAGAGPGNPTAAVLTAMDGNVPAAIEAMQFNYMPLNHSTPMLVLRANNMDSSIPANVPQAAWPGRDMCDSLLGRVIDAEMKARDKR